MLQPTNPLVISDDIMSCLNMAEEFKDKAETIVSVVRVSSSLPFNLYKSKKSNKLIKFNEQTERKRRQESMAMTNVIKVQAPECFIGAQITRWNYKPR